MKTESLATKSTRSAAWLYGQQLLTNSVSLVAVAILSRKLDPATFGIVALADTILRFGTAIGASTVSSYIIYDRKDGREERVQAAFWLDSVLTLVVVLILLLALPVITRFYTMPMLGPVLLVVLGRFAITQFCVVPDALIRRDLDYHKLVFRDTIIQLVAASMSVYMAIGGWGVWSLVIPGLILAIPRFFLVVWMARWKPNLPPRTQYWREIFSYTKHIMGNTFVSLITTDGDNLVVGKLFGSEGLGIYDRAWRTSNLITQNIVFVLSDVAMPTLSALNTNLEALRQAYYKMLRILSIISFPLLFGMFVLADEFILTLYGPKWSDSILLLRIFLIYTLQRSVGSPVGVVYNAMGRPDIALKINLILLPIYFASIFVGSTFGLVGIAVAITIVKTSSGLVAIYLACKLLSDSFTRIMKGFVQPLQISFIMGAMVYGLKTLVLHYITLPVYVELIFFSCVGGLIFLCLLRTRYILLLDDLLFVLDKFSLPISRRVRSFLHYPSDSQVSNEGIV